MSLFFFFNCLHVLKVNHAIKSDFMSTSTARLNVLRNCLTKIWFYIRTIIKSLQLKSRPIHCLIFARAILYSMTYPGLYHYILNTGHISVHWRSPVHSAYSLVGHFGYIFGLYTTLYSRSDLHSRSGTFKVLSESYLTHGSAKQLWQLYLFAFSAKSGYDCRVSSLIVSTTMLESYISQPSIF